MASCAKVIFILSDHGSGGAFHELKFMLDQAPNFIVPVV